MPVCGAEAKPLPHPRFSPLHLTLNPLENGSGLLSHLEHPRVKFSYSKEELSCAGVSLPQQTPSVSAADGHLPERLMNLRANAAWVSTQLKATCQALRRECNGG